MSNPRSIKMPKLIRDKMPEIIVANGDFAHTHVATLGEFKALIRSKVVEEAHEFEASPTLREAADLMFALKTAVEDAGFTMTEVEREVARMMHIRGRFTKRLVLDRVEWNITNKRLTCKQCKRERPTSEMRPADGVPRICIDCPEV